MANEQNLIKNADRTQRECTGVIKSLGVAKRRGQQFPQFPLVSGIIIE